MSHDETNDVLTMAISPALPQWNTASSSEGDVGNTNEKKNDNSWGPKHSRVGEAFQIKIDALPDPKQWAKQKSPQCESNQYADCIWDSKQALASNELSLLESITPHERREAALHLFHENGYKLNMSTLGKISQISPNHGLDWSPETKTAFSSTIIQEHKKFSSVSKIMNKSSGNCQNYYYGYFKRTHDYQQLKRSIKKMKRKNEAVQRQQEITSGDSSDEGECAKCNDVGELICCDVCERMYHLHCVSPPLLEVPEGEWFCHECAMKTATKDDDGDDDEISKSSNNAPNPDDENIENLV